MTLRADQRGERATKVAARPSWATSDKLLKPEHVEQFQRTQMSVTPREELEGLHIHIVIAYPTEPHIIFQITLKRPFEDFRALLGEVIEEHFGSTDKFRASFEEDLGTWSVICLGARDNPLFNKQFHVEDFLSLLDIAVDEARKSS
jgi:hypothetical protein